MGIEGFGGSDCAVCKAWPECMTCAVGYKAVKGESWDSEDDIGGGIYVARALAGKI